MNAAGMTIANLFTPGGLADARGHVRSVTPGMQPRWGKMSVAQMLAHCNVAYEIEYTDKHPRSGARQRLLIRL